MRTHAVRGALAALVLALAASTAASAQTAADDHQISALTDTYFGGVYGYDEAAIRSVTSPGFAVVEQAGRRLDRDAALAEMFQTFVVQNGYAAPTFRLELLGLSSAPDGGLIADVRTVAMVSALNGGPSPLLEEQATSHRMTWLRRDGKWVLGEDRIRDVSK